MENKKRYEDYIWMVKNGKVIPVEPDQVNNHDWVRKQRKWLRNLPGSGFSYLDISMEEAGELLTSNEENFPKLSPELALNLAINYKVDVRIQAGLLTELLTRRWTMDFDATFRHQKRYREYKSIAAEAKMYAAMLQLCLNGQFDRLMIDRKVNSNRTVWKWISFRR